MQQLFGGLPVTSVLESCCVLLFHGLLQSSIAFATGDV